MSGASGPLSGVLRRKRLHESGINHVIGRNESGWISNWLTLDARAGRVTGKESRDISGNYRTIPGQSFCRAMVPSLIAGSHWLIELTDSSTICTSTCIPSVKLFTDSVTPRRHSHRIARPSKCGANSNRPTASTENGGGPREEAETQP
jgi:hypothetical protein